MRKMILFLFVVLALACEDGKQIITGQIGDLHTNKIYLCEVVNQYRNINKVIDSADVADGRFTFLREKAMPELYFVGDNAQHGGYLFLDGKKIELKPATINDEEIIWQVGGSPLDAKYREYVEQKNLKTFKQIGDSLNVLFFQARSVRDTIEMARIKEESMPYYEQGRENGKLFAKEYVEQHKDSPLGISMYYSDIFQHKDFPTVESIESEKEFLNGFSGTAKNTRYPAIMAEQLSVWENCAIGHEAPEIVGKDTLGNAIHLSDFRGKYVLVDFWNSYCKWCRLETPHLLKAQSYFAGKDFTILGVSSDYYTEKWMEAIHEDKSYWNHMIVDKENQKSIFDSYCIKGIPHIILVGPDGKILAKELRGEDLIQISSQFVK